MYQEALNTIKERRKVVKLLEDQKEVRERVQKIIPRVLAIFNESNKDAEAVEKLVWKIGIDLRGQNLDCYVSFSHYSEELEDFYDKNSNYMRNFQHVIDAITDLEEEIDESNISKSTLLDGLYTFFKGHEGYDVRKEVDTLIIIMKEFTI